MSVSRIAAIVGIALAGVLGIVLVLGCVKALSTSGSGISGTAIDEAAKNDRWQAVILTNDRVYFGHASDGGNGLLKLDDAHFIQQQPGTDDKPGDLKVQPLSEELQQAESPMYVNVEHVVQLQNLGDDSRVAQAIESVS
jgi:hypothetical protein